SRNTGHSRRRHIAVIGDGAMTAGMAFEALNNAGVTPDVNMLVVLNDNDMSISPPVGALNHYLARLLSGGFYAAAKNVGKAVLQRVPPVLELARRVEGHAKGLDRKSTRLNSSHVKISYAVFCLKKKNVIINKYIYDLR